MGGWTKKTWLAEYAKCWDKGVPPARAPREVRVLFFRKGTKHVIYEYDQGYRRRTLLFANERGRDYYREGDVILTTTLSKGQFAASYPAAAAEMPERAADALSLALWFLNEGKSDTRMVAWKIKAVHCDGKDWGGTGLAEMTSYLRVGDDATPLITRMMTRRGLNIKFSSANFENATGALRWWCKAMVVVAQIGAQSAGSAIRAGAQRVLKKLLLKKMKEKLSQRARRRIFRAMAHRVSQTLGLGFTAFVKTYATKVATKDIQDLLRRPGVSVQQQKQAINPALKDACIAFVKGFMEGMFNQTVRKHIATSPLLQKAGKEVATALAKRLFTEPTNLLAEATAAAAEEAASNTNKTFHRAVIGQLVAKFQESLKTHAKDVLKGMAGKG
jgi:hemoglobin-like flavoprotein